MKWERWELKAVTMNMHNAEALENEKWAQFAASVIDQEEDDYASAIRLRADDIRSGCNASECPEHMREAVADYLESVAKLYVTDSGRPLKG